MVIRRNDVFGKPAPKEEPPALSEEAYKALRLMESIDRGMTLTRFQVELASTLEYEDSHVDVDNLIKTAVYALMNIDTADSDKDKITGLAIALEAITVAVDLLDTDLETVAKEVLDELR